MKKMNVAFGIALLFVTSTSAFALTVDCTKDSVSRSLVGYQVQIQTTPNSEKVLRFSHMNAAGAETVVGGIDYNVVAQVEYDPATQRLTRVTAPDFEMQFYTPMGGTPQNAVDITRGYYQVTTPWVKGVNENDPNNELRLFCSVE
jgi:hypothetical protein